MRLHPMLVETLISIAVVSPECRCYGSCNRIHDRHLPSHSANPGARPRPHHDGDRHDQAHPRSRPCRLSADRRRVLRQAAALGLAGALGPPCWRSARAQARRPRALPERQDQLEAGRGRIDHRRGDPGQLLREPDRAAAAVRGADRRQAALRESAAGADPAEGDARPVVEDRAPTRPTRPTRCTTRCMSRTSGSSRSTST